MNRNKHSRPQGHRDPQAEALEAQKEQILRSMNSPEGKRLLASLNRMGGLEQAAQSAMNGDAGGLQSILSRLQADPKNTAALEKLQRDLNK